MHTHTHTTYTGGDDIYPAHSKEQKCEMLHNYITHHTVCSFSSRSHTLLQVQRWMLRRVGLGRLLAMRETQSSQVGKRISQTDDTSTLKGKSGSTPPKSGGTINRDFDRLACTPDSLSSEKRSSTLGSDKNT